MKKFKNKVNPNRDKDKNYHPIFLIKVQLIHLLITLQYFILNIFKINTLDVNILLAAFPFFDRFTLLIKKLCCCSNNYYSYINQIENKQKQCGSNSSQQQFKAHLVDQIPQIRILNTSRLQLDPNISHPFVRIHLIDKKSGVYWNKKVQQNAKYHCQKIVKFNKDLNQYKANQMDIISSMATNNCDFRLQGSACCQWKDIIRLNVPAIQFFTSDLIILFQLLDFNHNLLVNRKHSKLKRDLTYPIAWGYIRPMGMAKRHLGISKLQLYRYQCDSKKLPIGYPQRFVPQVYLDFIWPVKQKYPGFLTVVVQPIPTPQIKQKYVQSPANIFQIQVGNRRYFQKLMGHKQNDQKQEQKKEDNPKNKQMIKLLRVSGEQCYIPDQIYSKLSTSQLGCYRLSFSNKGQILVCACSQTTGITSLRFYQTIKFKLIYQFAGHTNWIYSIKWSQDDKYLLTSSGDRTAKLWQIPIYTQQYIDQIESQSLVIATAIHTGYVYDAVITQKLKDRIYFVSGGSDCKLQVWQCDTTVHQQVLNTCIASFNLYERPQACFLNCLYSDKNGLLYVGDSVGIIHAFEFQYNYISRVSQVTNQQIQGVPITQIQLLDNGQILIATRSNVIRVTELTSKLQIKRRLFGSTNQKHNIGSCLSPDNKYLIAGSQDGKPYCWQLDQGVKIDHKIQILINGIISDCSWNKKYHMVAISGFGGQFPVYIFCHKKTKKQEQQAISRLKVEI